MSETEVDQESNRSKERTTVRFSNEEYLQIKSDQECTGITIPHLLKMAYFDGKRVTILFHKEDQRTILGELGRIGNNLNQIARALNSGVRATFHKEYQEINLQITALQSFLTSKIQAKKA